MPILGMCAIKLDSQELLKVIRLLNNLPCFDKTSVILYNDAGDAGYDSPWTCSQASLLLCLKYNYTFEEAFKILFTR